LLRRLTLIAAVLGASALIATPALAASTPTVTSVSAQSITTNSAALHAEIDPNGTATTYFFQFGLTTAYGTTSVQKSAGKGTKAIDAAIEATALLPGTVYHYRVVAENAAGETVGTDHSFTTNGNPPPGVSTGNASSVTTNSAVLVGVITPNNQATTYQFEYGTTTAYGSLTPPVTIPAGKVPVAVTAEVSGLASGTVFHFAIRAVHSDSPDQVGADGTFLTEPNPRPEPTLKATTKPKRAKRAPYTLTTTGTLTGYSSVIPATDACTGTVKIRLFNGNKRVSTGYAAVQSNCTFSLVTTLHKLPGKGSKDRLVKLKVLTYFNGNGYLGPRKASQQFVTLGRG
jgi:hypothetical protein